MANKHSCSHCQLTSQVIERLRLSFPPPRCEVSSGGGRQLKGAVEIISETLYPVAQKSTENYGKVREILTKKWSCKSLKISIHFLPAALFWSWPPEKICGVGEWTANRFSRTRILWKGISTVKMTSWWLNQPIISPIFGVKNSQNDWAATT